MMAIHGSSLLDEFVFCDEKSGVLILTDLIQKHDQVSIRRLGVTKIAYYRWRKEYGGMKVGQAERLKDLEKENARLKRLLADAELDKAILREAAEGNF